MQQGFSLVGKYKYLLGFTSIGIIYFLNMFLDVMDMDAAQYASISREMSENGSMLEIYHRGKDYLDKPPLLFWLSSLSFKIFGINNFSYKLPAILIIILGIYSTYRFTLLWYNKPRALLAAFILCSTQAFILITNDIRTDGLLTGFVIFSIWQISAYLKDERLTHLFFGAIGVAAAMMSKGPVGIGIVALAIGGDLILKRRWADIFKPQWLLFLLIVAILIAPMCYGLYTQFDLNPEKEVYGLKGPSGLKFFFWTQSFGRLTGDIYWKDSSPSWFFLQTMLWDFQPWFWFFIAAFLSRAKELFSKRFQKNNKQEYISFFGFLLSFLALSLANFKLPHYIFPLFPLAALISADFIISLQSTKKKTLKLLTSIHFGLLHIFFFLVCISFIFFFPPSSIIFPLALGIFYLVFWYSFIFSTSQINKIIGPTIISTFVFGAVLSTYFYPNLLKFQSRSKVGKEIWRKKVAEDRFYTLGGHGHSLDFYSRRTVPFAIPYEMNHYEKGTLILADQLGMEYILYKQKLNYKIVKTYPDFHITLLRLPFLLKSSRAENLKKTYLLEKL
ncbi:ArnT family glycosyltransferase [Xanthovirga aplysinae]|uniref:ArnT family glycosyltransferase n=1 Tax=Xanthovirga aplysinae TaxID=2529853 RepID=UPI0012BBBAE1|nr:glycosyltransferase family 39 protein [Xanthovirga aplysinae]MTI32544.1 hypothetical protein [Xanthovirga aplysinae]